MFSTKFLGSLLHIKSRNTAQIYTTCTGDCSCGELYVKQFGGCLCILAVHFIEVANLKEYNVVSVVVLQIIVSVVASAELSLTGLHFLILGFFFRSEISAVSDDIVESGSDLVPVQLHIGTIGLL